MQMRTRMLNPELTNDESDEEDEDDEAEEPED